MARPRGELLLVAERPMLEARRAHFAGGTPRAEFAAAMAAYGAWLEEHGASCRSDGASGMPDLEEYPATGPYGRRVRPTREGAE